MRFAPSLLAGPALALLLAGSAGAWSVEVGDYVKLNPGNRPGGGWNGGEFLATVQDSEETFGTFCLEKNEYFYWDQWMKVDSIEREARAGGIGGPNPDPLSEATAWLYTQFATGNLGTYGYEDTVGEDGKDLQMAFWYLEQEETWGALSAQAQGWVSAANLAVSSGDWTGLGDVYALNLKRWDGSQWVNAQSQLSFIPAVPEPGWIALAATGLVGALMRARRGRKR